MKHNRYISLLLCAGMSLAANSFAAGSGDEILARMGAIEIKRADMERLLGPFPAKATAEQIRAIDQALRTELIRRTLLTEAMRAEWDKKPDVRQQIDAAREQVIVSSYINQQVRPAPEYPTEAEVQAAYEANKQQLVRPPQVHLAQIYTKDAAKAEEVAKKAHEKGADFAQLSAKYSQHAESAHNNGDMGWLTVEKLTPEVRTVAEKLAPGEVSKPVKVADGWHVLKLIARKSAETIPLAEVRDRLSQSLRLKRAQENEQRYLDQIVSRTPITVNEIALSNIGANAK
jgi:parvulin-like peptidyl-prolyl isomerase